MIKNWEEIKKEIESLAIAIRGSTKEEFPADLANLEDFVCKIKDENETLKGLLRISNCPNCDGSGVIQRQTSSREYVTRSMALDAGDSELEGSLYSDDDFEIEQCQWCFEKNQILKEEQ